MKGIHQSRRKTVFKNVIPQECMVLNGAEYAIVTCRGLVLPITFNTITRESVLHGTQREYS
jgi:hypothetical protein